jgi:hypothetical protein
MLLLAKCLYLIAGSCAVYVALAPYFNRWHSSPSFFTLAYWVSAIFLFIAATLAPSKQSNALALIGSAFLTTRLAYGLTRFVECKLGLIHHCMSTVTFPPAEFDRVNKIMKTFIPVTLLISSLASLAISALRLRNRSDSPPITESSGLDAD